jgi:hypothetical protein
MHGEQRFPGQAGVRVSGQPGVQAGRHRPPAAAASRPAFPPRRIITVAVIVVLGIVAAVIGHTIAAGSSIGVGDCVVTNPNVLTGWDIKKVACNSNPGSALVVQQVVSIQSGSNGQCDTGLTTFQDDPSNKTYCLNGNSFGTGG